MLREGGGRRGISTWRSGGKRESIASGKVRLGQQGLRVPQGEGNGALELASVTECQSMKGLASRVKEFGFCLKGNELPIEEF